MSPALATQNFEAAVELLVETLSRQRRAGFIRLIANQILPSFCFCKLSFIGKQPRSRFTYGLWPLLHGKSKVEEVRQRACGPQAYNTLSPAVPGERLLSPLLEPGGEASGSETAVRNS